MAAIIDTRSHAPHQMSGPRRPALRLVPAADLDRVSPNHGPAATRAGGRTLSLPFSTTELAVALVAACVALALAVAIGHGAFSSLAPAPAGGTSPAASAAVAGPGTQVVVAPGDTLWSIARSIQPSGDVRDLVGALQAANGGSALLQPGATLVIPR